MIHGAVLVSAFLILWFLVLFCLLPVGLGAVDPETGAPLKPMLGRKLTISAVVATLLWVAFYILIRMHVVDL